MLDRRTGSIVIRPPTGRATGLAAVVVRWKAKIRKREERARDAMERKPLTIDPKHPLLCDALAAFARVSETDPRDDKAVAAAVRAIMSEPNWELNSKLLATVATAIVDQWSKHWTRDL